MITGAALAQAGRDMAERQLVGSWLACLGRVVHSLASQAVSGREG